MRRITRRVFCIALAVTVLALAMQTGTDTVATAQERTKQSAKRKPTSFEARFWDFLQSVQYRNWAPGPNQGLKPYPGKSPHGAFLRMYVNRPAAADPKAPPFGSIIVLENSAKKDERHPSLTVMYRVKDFDPDHNDWYWIRYTRRGTVAVTTTDAGKQPLAGKVKSCIDCHAKAKGGDFLFANDR